MASAERPAPLIRFQIKSAFHKNKNMNYKTSFVLLTGLCVGLFASAQAQEASLSTTSFETGQTAPAGWTSSDSAATSWEKTGHTGNRSISVSATKSGESIYWQWKNVTVEPGQLYRFSFWTKGGNVSSGCIVSGSSGANHDFAFSAQWTQYSFVFEAPQNPGYLRLGQWNATGKVLFDDVRLEPCSPLYANQDSQGLGEGEQINHGVYSFAAPLAQSNYARPLHENHAAFNSSRWVFSNDNEIIYQQQLPNAQQQKAHVAIVVNYYQGGSLQVDASNDGQHWVNVANPDQKGAVEADLPASLFPASTILVRLRAEKAANRGADSAPGSFQINSYKYIAPLAGNVPDAVGTTNFLALKTVDPQYNVKVLSLGNLLPGSSAIQMQVHGARQQPLTAQLTLQQLQGKSLLFKAPVSKEGTVSVPYDFSKTGNWRAAFQIQQNKKVIYAASTNFFVPDLYASDYGKQITGNNDLWWCNSSHKIALQRPLPAATDKSTFVPLSLARNEYEAVQIVAHPQKDISGVTVKATDLTGPNGTKIDSSHIAIDEVAYVHVSVPSDAAGYAGNWPDPLPPLKTPINLKAHQNQPFWITVYAPKNIPAGTYTGKVLLSGNNWKREVPLQVTVWNFTLSDTPHVKSAFGLSASRIAPYHDVSGNQLKQLMTKYYADFSAHRISPYDPIYGASIKVDWGLQSTAQWQGGTVDTANPIEGKHCLRVDDTDAHRAVEASWQKLIPVRQGQKYFLKYSVRTAKDGQKYQVTIKTYDANDKWISGKNLDMTNTGSTDWQHVGSDLSTVLINPRVHFVSISLRPAPWSSDGAGMGTVWFDDIQLMENDTTDLLHGDGNFEGRSAKVTPQQVKLDFSDFDAAMENAVAKYHISTFRLPIQGTGHRAKGGDGGTYAPGHVGNFVQGSPQYNILFGSYVKQLQDHLEKKGWLDKAFLYWYDEPGPGAYKQIAGMGDIIHRYAPKLKWMLTEQPEPELIHSVDIFCAHLNRVDLSKIPDLQKQGKEVWSYISTGAKAPYVGEFIDHPAIEPRLWLWQNWKNNVQGILIWATVYWTSKNKYLHSLQDPWQEPMSWSTDGGPWGNGDGRFLYPPRRDPNTSKTPNMDAPIDSIRWEAVRDGIEDYEYLWMLQQQVKQLEQKKNLNGKAETWLASAKVLLQVPDSISASLKDFSKDPTALLNRRAQIAEAIMAGKNLG